MDFSDIGIGMNLRLGIGICYRYRYRYEFWVLVSVWIFSRVLVSVSVSGYWWNTRKNQGFWKEIGIQNFTSSSSYSFNRIGIIPYPWFLWKERNIWILQNITESFRLPEFWQKMPKTEWKSSILVKFSYIMNLKN